MTSSTHEPKPRVSIIVAMAKNRVIGANNALPWHLSVDLKRFKALTMGHHIIMGRKTFESIGRVLPGRTSVVITRNRALKFEGVVVAHDLAHALEQSARDDEVFVIGGEQIFRAALPLTTRIYATEISRDYPGDTCFPGLDAADWKATFTEPFAEGDIRGNFVTYERTGV